LKNLVLKDVLNSPQDQKPPLNPPPWTVQGPQRAQLLIARNDFPTEWYQFLNPATDAAEQSLRLDLSNDRFPFSPVGSTNALSAVHLFVKLKDGVALGPSDALGFALVLQDPTSGSGATLTGTLTVKNGVQGPSAPVRSWYLTTFIATTFGTWLLIVKGVPASLQPGGVSHSPPRLGDSVQDFVLICDY
jgi:hypothetical protein